MSLYVPGEIISNESVVVDIGTGFLIEKVRGQGYLNKTKVAEDSQSASDAKMFYSNKISALDKNLKDIEGIAQGKSGNLRMIEEGRFLW